MRLHRHVTICQKVNTKRKAFDTSAMRAAGVAADNNSEPVDPRRRKKGAKGKKAEKADAERAAAAAAKKSKWKEESAQFRAAMKASREVTKCLAEGGDLSKLPPMPSSAPPTASVTCPHCARTFNETSGPRHIEVCGKRKNRALRPR